MASRKRSEEDEAAFRQAFADVEPLTKRPQRLPAPPRPQASRVAVERFDVQREDGGWVWGRRGNAAETRLRELQAAAVVPQAQLDLHGARVPTVESQLVTFLRRSQARGLQVVCIVHGKGHHSEGGVGVLGEVVQRLLTAAVCVPYVDAFVTPPSSLGGTGALLVRLRDP